MGIELSVPIPHLSKDEPGAGWFAQQTGYGLFPLPFPPLSPLPLPLLWPGV